MHAISQYRMIMGYADMVIWDACTAMAIWHAGMPSVLVSTHLTKIYQPTPKTQSGAGAYQPLDDPQHLKRRCRHYENQHQKICAHLCVCCRARLHCVPGCCEKCAATWGGTQCEITAHMCRARGVCSCAARACGAVQMQ